MSMTVTKAMVLAAGLGTRMRPLTDHLPKPLIPVGGKALIDWALDWLAASDIEEAVVNSHYKFALLEAHLARRARPRIHISREETLLETGGGIAKALPWLGRAPFLSLNSDTICLDGTQPASQRLAARWDDTAMDALLLLHPVEKAVGYGGKGDFFLDESGHLRRCCEHETAPLVFTGVQLLHPRLFASLPAEPFSMNRLYDRDLSRVHGLVHDGDWLHVGTPDERLRAENWLLR